MIQKFLNNSYEFPPRCCDRYLWLILSDDEVSGQVKCGWNQDWMLVSIIKTQTFEGNKFLRIVVGSSRERIIPVNDLHRNGRSTVPAPRASWSRRQSIRSREWARVICDLQRVSGPCS